MSCNYCVAMIDHCRHPGVLIPISIQCQIIQLNMKIKVDYLTQYLCAQDTTVQKCVIIKLFLNVLKYLMFTCVAFICSKIVKTVILCFFYSNILSNVIYSCDATLKTAVMMLKIHCHMILQKSF